MRNGLKKWMLWLTLLASALMLTVRLVVAPRGWLPSFPDWEPTLWVALIGAVTMVAIGILCVVCKSPATTVDHRQLASVSTVSILSGSALVLCSLFEFGMLVATGETPPPNLTVISQADGILLMLTFLFGILGGVFLAWLGFSWLTRYISYHGKHRLWALTPMVWAWMRLARYVVSYSSTVNVEKNIGEFLMMIFTTLFLFAFARYVAAVGNEYQESPWLLFHACGAFMFTFTPAVVRLVGNWDRSLTGTLPQMAGAADLAVGLLALAVAVAVTYTRRTDTPYDRVRTEHPEWLPGGEEREERTDIPNPFLFDRDKTQSPIAETPAEETPAADVPDAEPTPAAEMAEADKDAAVAELLKELNKEG